MFPAREPSDGKTFITPARVSSLPASVQSAVVVRFAVLSPASDGLRWKAYVCYLRFPAVPVLPQILSYCFPHSLPCQYLNLP